MRNSETQVLNKKFNFPMWEKAVSATDFIYCINEFKGNYQNVPLEIKVLIIIFLPSYGQ
jgi:hypothetical protein